MSVALSRRGFLGGILAAGAYAAGSRLFAAAPEDFDEDLSIFLSDVHVSGNNAPDPKTYKLLWELGFDSFGTDYPEALYQAIADGMK